MDKVTEKKYWQELYRRFQRINWEIPVTKEEVDELHTVLPSRQKNEEIEDWLQRILKPDKKANKPYFIRFSAFKCCAADNGEEQYPLHEKLESDDGRLELEMYGKLGKIIIKAKTGGVYLDELIGSKIGIAEKETPEEIRIVIEFDDHGKGEACVDDTVEMRRVLWNPVAGQIGD